MGNPGLSSLGGQIRRGELNESSPPIAHALSVELYAHLWYFCGDHANRSTCFRWPAITADSYAVDQAKPEYFYNGTDPRLQAGSLLAVPAARVSAVNATLKTTVGHRGTSCGL